MISLGLSSAEQKLFEQSLITGYNLKIKIQVLDLNHKYIADLSELLLDGQVDYQYFEVVTSTASMTLLDPDFVSGFDTSSPSDGALYADRMIRIVYSVYSELLPKWVDVPIFCGPVINVNRDDAIVSVECQDKTSLYVAPQMSWWSKTYDKGTKIITVVKDVFKTRGGETKLELPEYTWKLSKDRSMKPETSNWGFIGPVIGSRKSRQLWYDGRGVLKLRSKPTNPVFTFTNDHLLSVPKLEYNHADIRNTALVKGATPDGKPQLVAKRYLPAGDPSSSTALGRGGIKRYLVEVSEDDALNTQTEVNEAADELLIQIKTANTGFEFDSFVIPHLEPGDIFLLSTPEIGINLPLDQYSIPLTAGQPMSCGINKKISANKARLRRR